MLKAGKDKSDPSSYSFIALSNCSAKILEKMVNTRLIWFLEKNKILSKGQAGFRRGMSTDDHIAFLNDLITKTLAVSQHLVAVFIDFQKAFDRVWRVGLFIRLRQLGLRGRIFICIRNIFSKTFIRVKIDGLLSKLFEI